MHQERLFQFRSEAEKELKNILTFWQDHTIDHVNGGFLGKVSNGNVADVDAPKGSVLNGRILWTFSSAYIHFQEQSYLDTALRAYEYIKNYFVDDKFGGIYWTVDAHGRPAESKKQVYACAFVLYGLSEYCRASANEEAMRLAIELYHVIVEHASDKMYGGYFEAYTREWNELSDQRLSDKDENEKKSANTNLHVLEAFANLYDVWPDKYLAQQIRELLNIFSEKIIDHKNNRLSLFFDERWNEKPSLISYGHDIEAAWLLLHCARTVNDRELVSRFTEISVALADTAMNGLDTDGGLWYEYDLNEKKLVLEKHWWPQAEAVVGLINAWQITGEARYVKAALNCWGFIKMKLMSPSGEWYWGVTDDGSIMQEDKVGLWKCPYHNSRACLEILKRIN